MNDLQKFVETEFSEGKVVIVSNLSYYPIVTGLHPDVPRDSFYISHVNVDASIRLTNPNNKLIGALNILAINSNKTTDPLYRKGIWCLEQIIAGGELEIFIDSAQNYIPGEKISFYSGKIDESSSWSLHCDLSKK